jgi:hypothetical protein
MAEIVDSVRGMQGGALASVVHSFSAHGDVFVSSFVERLMTCLSVPIFTMIRQWIFRGELPDNEVCTYLNRTNADIHGDIYACIHTCVQVLFHVILFV